MVGKPIWSAPQVVVIGSSTGGTTVLEAILAPLPRTVPGMVIVQHMPAGFTRSFAQRLDQLCALDVAEATHRTALRPGLALIAPGGHHVRLAPCGDAYCVELTDDPPVNHHKPSVDVLFYSAAQTAGCHALGILLTGMGTDGAAGLKAMHDAGAHTIVQDEASCVVFGMPKAAIALGGVDEILPPAAIAQRIIRTRG